MLDRRARLGRYLQRWWDAQHAGDGTDSSGWRKDRDAANLASEFRRDPQFELSQARFLYRRPEETVVTEAVQGLSPPPSKEDAELLTEALLKAASTARKVRTTTAVGAMLTVFALVARNILRGR